MQYFIYDIAILLIIGIAVFKGIKMGFIKTFVQLVGWAVALYIATMLSGQIAQYIYNSYISDALLAAMKDAFALDAGVTLGAQTSAPEFLESIKGLPDFIQLIVAQNMDQISQAITQSIAQTGSAALEVILESIIAPLIVSLIKGIAFIGVFAVCNIVISLLMKLLGAIDYVPVVSQINSGLGAFAGLILGLAKVFVLAAVIEVLMVITNGSVPFLSRSFINSTILLKFFIKNNFIFKLYTL